MHIADYLADDAGQHVGPVDAVLRGGVLAGVVADAVLAEDEQQAAGGKPTWPP